MGNIPLQALTFCPSSHRLWISHNTKCTEFNFKVPIVLQFQPCLKVQNLLFLLKCRKSLNWEPLQVNNFKSKYSQHPMELKERKEALREGRTKSDGNPLRHHQTLKLDAQHPRLMVRHLGSDGFS